jgi:hypothetical protein
LGNTLSIFEVKRGKTLQDSQMNVSTIWRKLTRWTSAMDMHIPTPMRALDITKYVQDGCQRRLEKSTNGHTWKCAFNFCCNIMKERLSCNRLLQAMKVSNFEVETHIIA